MDNQQDICEVPSNDWFNKPKTFLMFWGLPMMILFSTNFITLPHWLITIICSLTFIWMGSGCLLNSKRCGRRHCYYSGPIFMVGAILVIILGFGLVNFTINDLGFVIWGTIIAVMLTFIPEYIWGSYRTSED